MTRLNIVLAAFVAASLLAGPAIADHTGGPGTSDFGRDSSRDRGGYSDTRGNASVYGGRRRAQQDAWRNARDAIQQRRDMERFYGRDRDVREYQPGRRGGEGIGGRSGMSHDNPADHGR